MLQLKRIGVTVSDIWQASLNFHLFSILSTDKCWPSKESTHHPQSDIAGDLGDKDEKGKSVDGRSSEAPRRLHPERNCCHSVDRSIQPSDVETCEQQEAGTEALIILHPRLVHPRIVQFTTFQNSDWRKRPDQFYELKFTSASVAPLPVVGDGYPMNRCTQTDFPTGSYSRVTLAGWFL